MSRYDGEFEIVFETTTAGVTIQSPQSNISTVAAGGGSRLFWRNGLFVTGPESASSDPGPACYRKSGPPAITDANLVLGRLLPEHFPHIFGPNEDQGLDVDASKSALEKLREIINADTGGDMSLDEVAWGFVKVANESMCRPIRSLTEARGYDTSNHVLACFGGAGGQHASAIADTLGIRTILIHKFSSVLSAYGMALAERVHEAQEPSAETWGSDEVRQKLGRRLDQLSSQVASNLEDQGFAKERVDVERYLNMRYDGTDTALMIKENDGATFEDGFTKSYKQEFGFTMDVPIVVDDVRAKGIGRSFDSLGPSVFDEASELKFEQADEPAEVSSVYFDKVGRRDVPVYMLDALPAGKLVEGPAMVLDGTQTIVIDPHWVAKVTSKHLLIEKDIK